MSAPSSHDDGAASRNLMGYLLILLRVMGSAQNVQVITGLVSKHLFSCSFFCVPVMQLF